MVLTVFVDEIGAHSEGRSIARGHMQTRHAFDPSLAVELVISSRIATQHRAGLTDRTSDGWVDFVVEPAISASPGPRHEIRLIQPSAPVVAMQALLLDIVNELGADFDAAAQAAVDAAPNVAGEWRQVVRERVGLEPAGGEFDQQLRREWASVGRNPERSPTVERWAQSVVEQNWLVAPTPPVATWRDLHRKVLNRVASGKLGQDALFVMFANYEALTSENRLLIDQELIRAAVDGLSDGDRFDPLAIISKYKIPNAAGPLTELSERLDLETHPMGAIEATKVRRIVSDLEAHGDAPRPIDIPPGLLGRADRMRDGQLYEVVGPAASMADVTRDRVKRAWEIGPDGQPTGRMETNQEFISPQD